MSEIQQELKYPADILRPGDLMDETMHRGRTTSKAGQRTALDCRDFPGSDCTLRLEGTEDEVLKAGVEHAISSHGYKNTPELKEQLRTMLVASP